MVISAADLLREYGAGATGIDRVLAHSGAPRGSVYHHFPGGRTQLIDEAVVLAGDFIAGLIDAAVQADDPVRAVDGFFALWRDRLAESGFRAGCPIVAVAATSSSSTSETERTASTPTGSPPSAPATADGKVLDDQGKLIAHATTTCMIL